jgi:hypothetical protein
MTEIIIAFLTGVLGPSIIIAVKYYFDVKKSKYDPVKDTLIMGNLITSKIDQIRDEFDADRVWITQFHNGGHFYPTGKSMAKFSMIFESVAAGVFSLQSSLQNIPVNLFSKSLNYLLENHSLPIPDYSDESIPNYGLKALGEGTGCKSGYFFSIKTIDEKFIGVLGIEYTNATKKLSEIEITELSNYASLIGGVLMRDLKR